MNFAKSGNRELFRAFIENGYRLNDGESREIDAGGGVKYFINNFVGTIEGGQLVGVWGTQRDITENKLAEQVLRESREYLEIAQESAQVGSFNFNFQTGLLTCSPSMESLYGASPGGLNGNLKRWFKYIHPEDLPAVKRELKQVAAGVSRYGRLFLPPSVGRRASWNNGSSATICGSV